jgi:hypothetical protein
VHNDVEHQAERVDKNVPLAARDLLARIVALRIDRGPPLWNGPPLFSTISG